jgi:autotransporter-associated beta strand protein
MKKGLLIFFVAIAVAPSFGQTNFFWRSEATDGNWAGSSNWWNGGPTAAGFGVLIFENNNQTTMTNNTSGTLSTFRLEFRTVSTNARTIGGNPVRFFDHSGTDPRIENQTSAHHIINFNIEGDGDAGDPLEINPVSGSLTLGGTINNRGSRIDIYGNSGNTLNLNGIISGSGAFRINQNSHVILTAQNTYTGLTTISAGSLRLNSGMGSTLPSTNNITVSGGTLRVSTSQTIADLDLSGGGNLTIDGGATLTVTGTYTPGAGTIDNQGTLVLQGSGALSFPTSTSITNMNNLTIDRSSGSVTLNQNLTIGGTLTLTNGTFAVAANTLTLNGGAIAGTASNLATTASSNLVFGGTNAGPLTIPSSVANLNNLTINNTNATPARIDLNSSPTIAGLLALTSGTLSIGANTLTLAGTVSRSSGLLRGGTTSNLTIQGSTVKELFFDHSTDGTTDVIQNLTLSSSGSMRIGNNTTSVGVSQLYVTGTLDIQSGTTLDVSNTVSANHLVLVSDGTNQARVANVAGTLTQGANTKIVVERFINGARRAWRFITAPLTGGGGSIDRTIRFQWQNHQTSPTNTLGGTSFGININGPASATGMDETTPGYTMRGWDYSTSAYANVTNTTTQTLFENTGSLDNRPFMTFIRGNKTALVGGSVTSARLRAVGRLQTGNQAFSYTGVSNHTTQFVPTANPYASPVDFESIRTSITSANQSVFYLWDPAVGSFGGWVTVTRDGSGNYDGVPNYTGISDANTRYIQSGVAYFLDPTSTSNVGITYTESSKVSNTIVAPTGAGNGLVDKLDVTLKNGTTTLDGVAVKFASYNSAGFVEPTEDFVKMAQTGETVSIFSNNRQLVVEGRPYILANDTIRLQMERMNTGVNYTFNFEPQNFDATVTDARLIDKFLNTETPISLTANTDIPFTITTTTGSNAADRFMIVFRGTGNLPNRGLTVNAVKQSTGVQVNWEAQAEAGVKEYELQHSATGTSFTSINNQVAKNGAITNNYSYTHGNPVTGVNYYRIKATDLNDNVRYSNVITINLKPTTTNPITVYPNPVRGKTIGLQVEGIEKGEYSLRVVNAAGQTVYSQNIQLQGSMSMQVTTSQLLAKGNYTVQLVNNKGANYQQQVLVVE